MKWFEVQAKAGATNVYVYDEIGAFGVPASSLAREIAEAKGKVTVYINSPGGSAADGIALYNALQRKGNVTTVVDGMAASAASLVAQGGTERKMGRASALMIHDAWGMGVGNAAYLDKYASELDGLSNQIADIYAARSGKDSPEDWRQRMTDETWYRGQQAVDAGLADSAVDAPASAYSGRVFNLSRFKNTPKDLDDQLRDRMAALFNALTAESTQPSTSLELGEEQSEMTELAEVRGALGLDEDGDPIAAINALKGEVKSLKATISSDAPDKGEAASLRAELQAAQKAILEADAEHARDTLELRERVASMKAEVRVEQAIGRGKITPANRDYALKVARDLDEDGWDKFVRTLPSVNLSELGSMADGADIEPTAEEAAIARQMGIDTKQLVQQKVRDLS